MSQPRLLLADDHKETAELLCGLLGEEFDVIEQVHDGYALLRAVERLSPDVIVSDISMPGIDGITAAKTILRKHPTARIVFVSVHCEPIMVARGLEAGALGYVLKRVAGDELVVAVRSAMRGERHVSTVLFPNRDATKTS